jgi:hypothetical protein
MGWHRAGQSRSLALSWHIAEELCKEIGVTIPPALLVRADEIIE